MTAHVDSVHAQVPPRHSVCRCFIFCKSSVTTWQFKLDAARYCVHSRLCQHNQLRGSASVDSNITPKAAPAVHRRNSQNTIDASHNAVVMHMSATSSRRKANSSPRINPTFAASSVAVSNGQRVQQRDGL
jgi:hypothetical protein